MAWPELRILADIYFPRYTVSKNPRRISNPKYVLTWVPCTSKVQGHVTIQKRTRHVLEVREVRNVCTSSPNSQTGQHNKMWRTVNKLVWEIATLRIDGILVQQRTASSVQIRHVCLSAFAACTGASGYSEFGASKRKVNKLVFLRPISSTQPIKQLQTTNTSYNEWNVPNRPGTTTFTISQMYQNVWFGRCTGKVPRNIFIIMMKRNMHKIKDTIHIFVSYFWKRPHWPL